MPASPTIEIVKSAPIHVKGGVGGPMPSFKSDAPIPQGTPPPSPVPGKLTAAPPVPPPLESQTPSVRPLEPHRNKVKEDMFKNLRKKAEQQPPEPETEPTGDEPKPDEPKPEETPDETKTIEEEALKEVAPAEGEAPKKKLNGWQWGKTWKEKALAAEQALAETKKLIPDEAGRKTEMERFQAAEKRAQELEQEIKFVNYSKSAEFKEKFWDPYEKAYNDAFTELSELEVVNADGEPRKVAPADFNEILFAPSLMKAKAIATERFGEYAEDVMGLRKEVRRLHDLQSTALKQARELGVTREKEMARQYEDTVKQLSSYAKETWEKANQSLLNDPDEGHYFKPVEGDEERNAALQKGYELFDKANSENPLDPRLTPEDRASIVKRHAATRARAAAYPVLKHELKKIQAQLKEATEKLSQYEASTPDTNGGRRTTAAPVYTRATDRVFARLRSLAAK